MGVPFDGTSSFRRGSSLAPDQIRAVYENLESFDPYYAVDFTDIPITDLGNLEVNSDVREVISLVDLSVSTIRGDGKIPIMMGGEHSITIGAIKNYTDADLIIIDAHSDFRESYGGSAYSHACVTRRCLDILGDGRITSIGTRSISREEYESKDINRVSFISSAEVRKSGIELIVDEVEKSIRGDVYLSIDMDGFDPSFAPAVGTPEPYGLTPWDARYLMNRLGKRIIGFDIVEFSPIYDNGNTAMLAAKLIQDFIGSRETSKVFH